MKEFFSDSLYIPIISAKVSDFVQILFEKWASALRKKKKK